METYKFSRLRTIFIKNFGRSKMDFIGKIVFVLTLIGGIVYALSGWKWLLIFPIGFPFMPFVLFRMGIQIAENFRIKRYCKRVGITTDEFNAMYGE